MSDSSRADTAVSPSPTSNTETATAARRALAKRFDQMLRYLEYAHVPLVLAIAFLLACGPVRNSDFWLHLATGKKIAAGEYRFFGVGNDPFSFGTESIRWINHAWLFDLGLYLVWSIGGGIAVILVKAMVVAALAAVLFLACRPNPDRRIETGSKADPSGWLTALLITGGFIAAAPRLLLQPTIASYLLLGVTIWLLMKKTDHGPTWRLPAMLAVIFALWVNLDGWFFIGPVAVLLALIGETAQHWMPGSERPKDWTTVRRLGFGLVAGTAACLLNPDFFNAFTLPFEVYAPELTQSFRDEIPFRTFFISPLDNRYRQAVDVGNNPAGIAYALLLVSGIAALALNVSALRMSQVLLAAGFALLSLRTWRGIPFFAIVIVPIIVQNLHACFARREARRFDDPELMPGGISAAPPKGGGIAVTPDRVFAFLGLTGRLLTLALLLVAGGLAYFGKLHANPMWPELARPATWSITPDSALRAVAEQLQLRRAAGTLPPDVRGFNYNPEIANYYAWFGNAAVTGPPEKSFFDYRLQLHRDRAADYLQIRKELQNSRGDYVSDDLAQAFRKYDIGYVSLPWQPDQDREDGFALTLSFYTNAQDWSLWAIEGLVTVAGWKGHSASAQTAEMRIDLVHKALGPNTVRTPPPGAGRMVPDGTGKLQWRSLWDEYFHPYEPEPPEGSQSLVYYEMHRRALKRTVSKLKSEQEAIQVAGVVGLTADSTGWSALLPRISYYPEQTLPVVAWYRDDELVALPLLAVRAARRGIASKPDDPLSYIALSRAYEFFEVGTQMQPTQIIGILRQGLVRAEADERKRKINSIVFEDYLKLVKYYLQPPPGEYPSLDLAVECLREALKRIDMANIAAQMTPEEHEQFEKSLREQLKQMEAELRPRQENFILAAAQRRKVLDQYYLARERWLSRDALEVLKKHRLELDPDSAYELVRMHLLLGQVEDAKGYLDAFLDQVRIDTLIPGVQYRFRWLKVETAIAAGDLAGAGAELEKIVADMKSQIGILDVSLEQAAVAPWMVGFIDSRMAPTATHLMRWLWSMRAQPTFNAWGQLAAVCVQRAVVALEEGDNAKALEYFQKALDVRGMDFQGRTVAARYVPLLRRELSK